MKRWSRPVVVLCLLAVPWAALTAHASYLAKIHWLYPASADIAYAAVLGWLLRDRDILDVLRPALVTACGLVATFVLVGIIDVKEFRWGKEVGYPAGASMIIAVFSVFCVLILALLVSYPVSLIPVRKAVDKVADDRFVAFVRERNAYRNEPPG